VAFSSFWSILELFEQKKRVEKGWFPKKRWGGFLLTNRWIGESVRRYRWLSLSKPPI
jgi:hypothetical protein